MRPSGGRSSAGWSAGPRTAHQRGRRYGGRRCRDQYPHLADVQRTTHEAAEGTGSHDCAAAAGADHHRTHSSAWSRDQLHRCRCRLRHLHHLRSLRHRHRLLRLHCCHLHLHPRHHSHQHPHPLHCLHHHLHRPRQPLQRPCPPCPCRCGVSR
ncbi:unnamed protein product [Closterium sp. NIES-53]